MSRSAGRRPRIPRWIMVVGCALLVLIAFMVYLVARQAADEALPRASCGSAVTHVLNGDTKALDASPNALSCFQEAARACRSASIRVTESKIDWGSDHLLTVERGKRPCHATMLSQEWSANSGGWRGQVTSAPCARVEVTGRGVVLSCAGGVYLVPAVVYAPTPPGGVVTPGGVVAPGMTGLPAPRS